MHVEDLPRLSDEDREALDDGYVAVEGVAAPFGSGPMPIWLQFTLLSATATLALLVWYAWKLGRAERAKSALAERVEREQDHWNALQTYGDPGAASPTNQNLPRQPNC